MTEKELRTAYAKLAFAICCPSDCECLPGPTCRLAMDTYPPDVPVEKLLKQVREYRQHASIVPSIQCGFLTGGKPMRTKSAKSRDKDT